MEQLGFIFGMLCVICIVIWVLYFLTVRSANLNREVQEGIDALYIEIAITNTDDCENLCNILRELTRLRRMAKLHSQREKLAELRGRINVKFSDCMTQIIPET